MSVRFCFVQKFFMVTSLLSWLLGRPVLANEQKSKPASPHSLDFADWSDESRRDLTGPWEFYWKKLLSPTELAPAADFLVDSRQAWNTLKNADGRPLESLGFGSFRLVLRDLKSNSQGYSIMLPWSASAMHAYLIANDTGQILSEDQAGRVGQSKSEEIPSIRPIIFTIAPEFSGDLTLLVHVSNYHLVSGGLRSTPSIAMGNSIQKMLSASSYQDLFVIGVTFAIGIYLFMMWFRNRRDLASLCLVFVCIGSIIRTVIINPILLMDFFESHYLLLLRWSYFSISFGGAFGVQFIGRSFAIGKFGQRVRDSYFAISILTALTPFVFDSVTFSKLLPLQQIVALSAYLFYYPVLVRASYRREEGGLLCLFGVVIVFAGLSYDIIVAMGLVKSNLALYPSCFALFLIMLSQIVAKKAATAHSNAEVFATDIQGLNQSLKLEIERGNELNAQLEVKVVERTREVRSLLQHIPQGILTIGKGGVIGVNYSAHLPEIIGEKTIANRSFKELVLDKTDLSADARDRAWQSILGSVGDIALNFDVNFDNFPTQFSFHGPQDIVLKCTWNIEVDGDDVIKNILVTLLDVTGEFESNKRLEEKNNEFALIRQLIDIEGDKAKQFFSSGVELLDENQRLLSSSHVDEEAIKILFINMHTLKGSARTLHLLALAECLHLAESYYADILRQGAPIDLARLRHDQSLALEVFHKYQSVNHDILGRSINYSEVSISRDFLEQNFQILKMLDSNQIVGTSLKQIIHDNCEKIVKLIFLSLPSVLHDIMKSANRIAKDLNKPEPAIEIDLGDILINHKQEVVLRNSFIHLLRNSLDHGIENVETRQSKGKAQRGKINLHGEAKDGKIVLYYQDDGAGLCLAKLRKMGLEGKHIKPDSTPEEIAELMFLQGMSTSSDVTVVSGRGMGMNAIRRFLATAEGSIAVRLGPPLDDDRQFYQFSFVIEIPSQNSVAQLLEKDDAA